MRVIPDNPDVLVWEDFLDVWYTLEIGEPARLGLCNGDCTFSRLPYGLEV